jgi:16S rRNA (cytidine1402-2'-O)-methyltransferase
MELITPDMALTAGLYIVSTPIGNLRDITLRALDVLKLADHILAEDTRQTGKLLGHYNIKAELSAYHDHNAAKRVPKLVERLEGGEVIALVSDAGTPLVSDPGYKLARAAIEAGVKVIPIPGASAVLAALTLSGLPSDRFSFGGFLPPKTSARKSYLQDYTAAAGTLIFFETAPRLAASLKDIRSVLGDRPIALTRELTKRYEEARYGSISAVVETLETSPPRGEIVLCIGPSSSAETWESAAVEAALPAAIAAHGVKQAASMIAGASGWKKRNVYQLALTLKEGGDGAQ